LLQRDILNQPQLILKIFEEIMAYTTLNNLGIKSPFKEKYDNFIGGKWVKPVDGKYFENITPISGKPFCEVARSNEKDIELALDAAHLAKDAWGKTSTTNRSNILLKIADVMEKNLEVISLAETIEMVNQLENV